MNPARLTLAAALLLAIVVFLPALRFSFVYDDLPQIVDNPALRSWQQLPQAFTHHLWARGGETLGSYYRPVFSVWLLFGYHVFGIGIVPWAWHLASILLHALATWLVYRVSMKLVGDRRTAAIAALLFAVYPIHIENVAWISGSVDVLLAVFLLASFLAFLKSIEHENGWLFWLALSLLLFGIALLTKETAIVFPVVVMLSLSLNLFWNKGDTRPGKLFLVRTLPFFLLGAGYLFLRWCVLGAFDYPRTPLSTTTLLLTSPWALCWYLWHQILPIGLSLFYDQHYVVRLLSCTFVLPVLFLFFLAACAVRFRERMTTEVFLLGWFFVFLLPCLNLRSYQMTEVTHDRYLYLPSVAFCLLLARLLQALARRSEKLCLYVATALVVALAMGTLLQEAYYRDNYTLAVRGVTIAPRNTAALLLFARELSARGRVEESLAAYNRLTREVPLWWTAWYERGVTALRFERWAEASVALARAEGIDAREPSQYYLQALAESHLDHKDQARAILQQGIANAGDAPMFRQGLEDLQKTGSAEMGSRLIQSPNY